MDLLPIIISSVAVLLFIVVLILVTSHKKNKEASGVVETDKYKQKNRAAIIRDATKKLAHNPQNVQALLPLADLYYREHLWDKASPLYETLTALASKHTEIDMGLVNLRRGVCLVKLDKSQEAISFLLTALKLSPENYEANLYLGNAFYKTGDYEKAVPLMRKAITINPESNGVYAPLGMALYKAHHFKEAIQYLRKALDENPQNKEALFAMADSMQECGLGDKALKVFTHLRPDPVFGAQSSLYAGIIHTKMNQMEAAVQDFEIGLKLKDVPQEIYLELNYRLAACYFKTNNFSLGLDALNRILMVVPVYKDTAALVTRYKELNQNSNLQVYLTSGTSDFVALCRNLVKVIYAKSFVKIIDVSVVPDSIEILCDVENSKWEDKELFRFYRNSGSVGELYIRDFHGKIRDAKCDKGICITSGTFSEEAHKYIDGRPIDLIEKPQLMRLLKMIT